MNGQIKIKIIFLTLIGILFLTAILKSFPVNGETKIYGDARFIESYLRQVFFSIYEKNAITEEKFDETAKRWIRFPEVFGGYCRSLKKNSCIPRKDAGYRKIQKNSNTPLREAYKIRACIDLFKSNGSFAKSKLLKHCESADERESCVTALSTIFYPGQRKFPIPALPKHLQSSEQIISFFSLQLCLSEGWQSL